MKGLPSANNEKMDELTLRAIHLMKYCTHQIGIILKCKMQRRDPCLVPINKHISFFFEAGRLKQKRAKLNHFDLFL